MTKDQWIQKAKALLFDVEAFSDLQQLIDEARELIEEGGGYDYNVETEDTELRWRK